MVTATTKMQQFRCFAVIVSALTVMSPWHGTAALPAVVESKTSGVDLLMPGVQPQKAETYLCHGMKLQKDPMYIVGFQPHANMMYAHHVLIYGCTEPGDDKPAWNCGEMHTDSSQFETAPICAAESSRIVYAWAMDAPELKLPPGVGFKVGGDTDIKWLVLQVHYKDVTPFVAPNNGSDHSGVTLITSSSPQPKRAGVYLMGTGGEIPPHSVTYMETACEYTEPFVMHPFAFRTHAHVHGRVVSGYRIRDDEWLEIGRMSPQKPQMFYNVSNPGMTVKSGDVLAARCTMVNDEDRTVKVGSTGNDEMCNFYIMYYVDNDQLVSDTFCFTEGPPSWDWSKFENGLIDAALAPLSASVVPGSDDFLAATDWFIADRQRALLESERLDDLIDSIQARQPNDDEDEEAVFDNEMQNPGFDWQEPGN